MGRILKQLSKLFKRNTIEVSGNVSGNINQNVTMIDNPALSINRVKNNPEELQISMDGIAKALEESSILPPGYKVDVNIVNGKTSITSKPCNEAVQKENPQYIKGDGTITIPEDMDPEQFFRQAWLSQKPIPLKMNDMKIMIGTTEDPFQKDFQDHWKSSSFELVMPPLPPARKCILEIEGSPYKYPILLKQQPMEDGTDLFMLSNSDEKNDLTITLMHHQKTDENFFSHKFIPSSWESCYKYLRFMQKATKGKKLSIIFENTNVPLLSVILPYSLLDESEECIASSLEIYDKIISIEKQFDCKFPVVKEITNLDLENINFIWNSIRGEPTDFTWDSFSFTGIISPLISIDSLQLETTMRFNSPDESLIILGVTIDNLTIHYHLESTIVDNAEEIAHLLSESDSQKRVLMKHVPGPSSNIGHKIIAL